MKTLSFLTFATTKTNKFKVMKKFIFIIGILTSLFAMAAQTEQTRHQAYVQKSNATIGNRPHRAPALLPSVEIVYDSDSHSIVVICSDECEARVEIYDSYGKMINSSNSMSTVLYIPNTSNIEYDIKIVSDFWFATVSILS